MSSELTASSADRDRRTWERHLCNLETLYQPGTGELDQRWGFARVCNISHNGVGMVLQRRFEPGTLLAVALFDRGPALARTLQTTVVRAVPHPEGWLIGCSFSRGLSEEELRAFGREHLLCAVVDSASSR